MHPDTEDLASSFHSYMSDTTGQIPGSYHLIDEL